MASSMRNLPWRTCHVSNPVARSRARHPFGSRYLSTTRSSRSGGHAGYNPLRSEGPAGRQVDEQLAQSRRSIYISAAGILLCAAAMYGTIKLDVFGLEQLEAKKNHNAEDGPTPNEVTVAKTENNALKCDGPSGFPSTGGPSVIPLHGQDLAEQVPTGNSSVPEFPTTIRLPSASETNNKKSGDQVTLSEGDEYQLLGLGIRTVSFLSIQVYVVGLYVAKADITELQQRLVRMAIHPPAPTSENTAAVSGTGADAATSLVPPERQQLKELLLDPERGDAIWSTILKEDGIRTAFRIVPTRNTDFMHLRDGWIRGITNRAQQKKVIPGAAEPSEFQDASFGTSMNDFKAVFGGGHRKNVPKGQTLILRRDAHGALDALFQSAPAEPMQFMGHVTDERISRLVWLNYLAGKTVSSEGARKNIVDGLMTIVERPVGTVVQRVV